MKSITLSYKKKFIIFALILAMLLSNVLTACDSGNNVLNFNYFNTFIHIESYSKKIDNKTSEKIKNILQSIEDEFSIDKENSFVYKFNSLKKDQSINGDEATIFLFNKSQELYQLTDGKFDISLLPLTTIWNLSSTTFNNGLKQFTIPDKSDIENVQKYCDLNSTIKLNENNTFSKLNDNAKIDFGGIAKGYAVDKIVNILKESGIKDGYVSIGASSMYIFDASNLSIRHPRKTSEMPTIISLNSNFVKNTAISTSGDYERYFEKDNKRYCHIIDKTTGSPIETNIVSATVLCDNNYCDGTLIDGLSTALMTYSYDSNSHKNSPLIIFANKLISTYSGIQLLIVCIKDDEKIILTNISNENFSLLDNEFSIKTI